MQKLKEISKKYLDIIMRVRNGDLIAQRDLLTILTDVDISISEIDVKSRLYSSTLPNEEFLSSLLEYRPKVDGKIDTEKFVMHQYSRKDLNAAESKRDVMLQKFVNKYNGPSNIINTLFRLRLIYNKYWDECPMIYNIFKLIERSSKIDSEIDYLRQAGESIINNTYDSQFVVRVMLSVNCAVNWFLTRFRIDYDTKNDPNYRQYYRKLRLKAIEDVYGYFFMEGAEHALDLKGIAAPWITMWGCDAPSDLVWGGDITRDIPKRCTYIRYVKYFDDALQEARAKLREFGLISLLKYLDSCAFSKEEEGLEEISFAWFIDGLYGYYRSITDEALIDGLKSNLKTTSDLRSVDGVEKKDYPYDLMYQSIILNILNSISSEPETQLSNADKVRMYLNNLTSRSSGFIKVDQFKDYEHEIHPSVILRPSVNVRFMMPKNIIVPDKITVRSNYIVTTNNKILSAFLDYRLISPEWILKWSVNNYTESAPILLASRSVPSRAERAVFINNVITQNSEVIFTEMLRRYVSRLQREHLNESYHVGTPNVTTGAVTVDMGIFLRQWRNSDILFVASDFSKYDQSQAFNNVRKNIILAIEKWKRDHHDNGYFDSVLNSYRNMDKIPVIFNIKGEKTLFHTNQVLSGEIGTIWINTVTNISLYDHALIKSGEYEYKGFSITHYLNESFARFQGDDIIQMIIMQNLLDEDDEFIAGVIQSYIDMKIKIYAENGFIFRPDAFVISPILMEFLKKVLLRGRLISRSIQIFLGLVTSENSRFHLPPTDRMNSFIGIVKEGVARGLTSVEGVAHIYAVWATSRKMIKDSESFRLPVELIHVPISHGGCDYLPWGGFDITSAIISAYKDMIHPDTYKFIKNWMYRWDSTKLNIKKDFTKSILKNVHVKTTIKYLDRVLVDHDILRASMEARKKLERKTGYDDIYSYQNRNSNMVFDAINDSPALREISILQNFLKYYNVNISKLDGPEIDNNGVRFVIQDEDCNPDWSDNINPMVEVTDDGLGILMKTFGPNVSQTDTRSLIIKRFNQIKHFLPNINANDFQSIARTIVNNHFSTDDIALLLRSRGIPASKLAGIDLLLSRNRNVLASIANMNGYSASSDNNINVSDVVMRASVEVIGQTVDDESSRELGFIFLRNQVPRSDGKLKSLKKVKVYVDSEKVLRDALYSYGGKVDELVTTFLRINENGRSTL